MKIYKVQLIKYKTLKSSTTEVDFNTPLSIIFVKQEKLVNINDLYNTNRVNGINIYRFLHLTV